MIDYMILEAVALKVSRADEEARKQVELKQWQESRGKELLEQYG